MDTKKKAPEEMEINGPGLGGMEMGKNVGTGDASYEEWLGTPPEFDHIDVELEADVIVCGAGLAGVSATRAATEEGASVILFEKTSKIQCRFGDIGVVGSKISIDNWGRDGSEYKEEIVASFMKDSSFWPRQRIIKYWIDNCGAAVDWYVGAKEDIYIAPDTTSPIPEGTECWIQPARYPGPEHYDPREEYYPCYQITVQLRPDQAPVLKAAYDKACDTGLVQTYFTTPVKKLLRGDDGRVYGVIAQSYDGKVYKAIAKKGVILATGDYSGNLDMLYHYVPWARVNPTMFTAVDPEGNVADTGDGHRMGMWIGAQMERGPHAPMIHNMGGPLGVAAYLQLNNYGERFYNEDVFGQQVENQLTVAPDHILWQIFDAAWPEQLPYMSAGHGSICLTYDPADVESGKISSELGQADGYIALDGVEKAAAAGQVIKADTIEELVEKMGIPKETALASIERYNELCRKGHDDDFGKMPSRLFALENAPFYAAKLTAAPLLVCMSGLESDHNAHCMDADGHWVEGLYVCGNVQGGRFAIEYPTTVPGMSHSMALTYGRLAGMNAAKGI